MRDILDTLVQEIERGAFPYFYTKSGYRQDQHRALEHMRWLEEHLDDEAMAHLEQMQDADLRTDNLEREALVRTALAVGIRLALPH